MTEYEPVDGDRGTCPECGESIMYDAEGRTWIHDGGWKCLAGGENNGQ
jgi:ribosomal protein S27AE